MSKAIDLGRKWGESLGEPTSIEDMRDEVHYPDLHIGDIDDARLADMPDEGEMTVRYKIRSRTHNEREHKGKKKHTCSISMDILSIDPPESKKKKNGSSDGGARKALSEYFKDK